MQSLKQIFKIASGMGMAFPAASLAGTGAAASLALGPLAFGAPWVLAGAVALPGLWWLMKSIPPKPVRHDFPAINILFNMESEDQSPATMKLWQRLLRLAAAGMVITGLAQPQFQDNIPLEGDGPVKLVVDNGWSSSRGWAAVTGQMNHIIDRVERENRMIIIVPTADPADGSGITPSAAMTPEEARRYVKTMRPQPWPVNRKGVLAALDNFSMTGKASVIWLSNGLDDPGAMALAERLQSFGKLTVMQDKPAMGARLLVPPMKGDGGELVVSVRRAAGDSEDKITLTASDDAGRSLAQKEAVFKSGETEIKVSFDLPKDVRAKLMRIQIDGENSAGAVVLMDERWQRRPVGLIESLRTDRGDSTLSADDYVHRALEPYVDLRHGNVDRLLEKKLSVMILTDSTVLGDDARKRIKEWVQQGGTLLRFAGKNLADNQEDDGLVAAPLRPGSRAIQGEAGRIAPFETTTPFSRLTPPEDIRIERGVMAQPGPDLEEQSWARLEDGTPLVTARREGEGWVVLVHTTANTEWSNLPLSTMFTDMMRAVVQHSNGIGNDPDGVDYTLPAIKTLDGYGQMIAPQPGIKPLTPGQFAQGVAGPHNPPGFYGHETMRIAYNLSSSVPEMKPLPEFGEGVSWLRYSGKEKGRDLSGPILAGAMSLLLIDMLVLFGQQGMLPRMRREEKPGPALIKT